jgi:tRNA G37 N-methylase Trm5
MISEKRRAERLRRHEELKGNLEAKLAITESESDKEHLIARIAEVQRNIDATKLPEVTLPEPMALLPEMTKTAEEDAMKPEEHVSQPLRQKTHKPKLGPKKIKTVGNPF